LEPQTASFYFAVDDDDLIVLEFAHVLTSDHFSLPRRLGETLGGDRFR
jgi:hypothetical protein